MAAGNRRGEAYILHCPASLFNVHMSSMCACCLPISLCFICQQLHTDLCLPDQVDVKAGKCMTDSASFQFLSQITVVDVGVRVTAPTFHTIVTPQRTA